ncbi:MAG: hypothetical protein KGJ80_01205 [Chloroflexota bacterium]|nr:hypothetical protein [Chloroflexota bacterium]
MPDWILLLPILFPLAGALLFPLAARGLPKRIQPQLPIIFLAIEIIAILVNIAPGSHTLVISTFDLAGLSIVFQIDGVTLLLLLTMFVPLVAVWWVAPPRSPFRIFSISVSTAAILLSVSGNLISIYFAWTLLDLSIFAWRFADDIERDGAARALALSQLAGLGLFAGALMLDTQPSANGAVLVALAFWARLALFPFHWTLPMRGSDTLDLWFARGVPLLAASSLWLRGSILKLNLPITLIGALAAAAMIAAAIWIWREEQPPRAVVVSVSHALAFVPLAIAFGGAAAPAFALWLALSVAMALALFEISLRWRAENRNRYPRLIWFAGILSLAGLPLTPAFLSRVGVYTSLWESGQWLLLLLAGVTTTLVLAPLWNLGFEIKGAEKREPTRREYAGLAVIVLAGAALALAPMLIAPALAPSVSDSAERAIDRVIRTNDLLGVVIGFTLLVLPVMVSYWLRRAAGRFHPHSGSLIWRAARLIDLEWLERALTSVGYQMGALARGASMIAEENPTVWILFAALWVAIFISIFH